MFRHWSLFLSFVCLTFSTTVGDNCLYAEDWSPLWSTGTLSQPRSSLSAVTAGGNAYFIGGSGDKSTANNAVDIYDASSGTWATATLPKARYSLAAASDGNTVFAGGGNDLTIGSVGSFLKDVLWFRQY